MQTRQAVLLPSRLDAHSLTYRWQVERWLSGVYSGTQQRYTALVAPKVDPEDRARWVSVATAQARDWVQVRGDLRHVLVNQRECLCDVTPAEVGFVLPHDTARIAAVSSDLRGGLIIRRPAWAPDGRLVDRSGLEGSEYRAERLTSFDAVPPLALLGRSDLDVVLFIPEGEPAPRDWRAGPERVEVATAAGRARFSAFRASLYGEVEVSRLAGGAFVLVKRRF